MTVLPNPLAAVLETLSEVRQALAYVPRLCELGELEYASEVVAEQRAQLAELRWQMDALQDVPLDSLPLPPTAPPTVPRTPLAGASGAGLGVSPRPLSAPGRLPRPNPDIGFADEPMF